MDTPHPATDAPRRHHSRQRDELLACLRATRSHPTAAQLHETLRERIPALALATVYRNLEVLVSEGLVLEVPTASGGLRYDGNLEAHDHFDCERCGCLLDLPAQSSDRFTRKLARNHGLHARRVQISFIGTCPECERREIGTPTRRASGPDRKTVFNDQSKEGSKWPI